MKLRVGTFGGVSALPLLVARQIGLFERAGLDVSLHVTTDSEHLRVNLQDGTLPIVHLAPDNVMAWSDVDASPIRAWLAGSGGPISLLSRGVTEVLALRGRMIAVDSPRSGFAPILAQLLRAGGVEPGEVELVPLGATRLRFQALQAGDVAATMLTMPWSELAVAGGATLLGNHNSVAPGLLTSCAASLAGWLTTNASVANDYADAVDAAVAWLRNPANRDQGEHLLANDMNLGPAVTAGVLEVMLDERLGWPSSARLLGPELGVNWRLRADAVGEPGAPPAAYVHVLPRA